MPETQTANETPVLPVANPRQFTEAWGSQVAGAHRPYVLAEWRDYGHRCTVSDPIYYRQQDGWHQARNIRNPAAIRAMRKGLALAGVRAPDDVEAAWVRNENHSRARVKIEAVVSDTLRAATLDTEPGDLLTAVTTSLEALRPTLEAVS